MKKLVLLFLSLSLLLVSCKSEQEKQTGPQKVFADIERDFGVPLNKETRMVYSMGYSGAAQLNRHLSDSELERSIPRFGGKKDKLRKVYLAGMKDAMERRPNRIKGMELPEATQ